jgi:hypothetical protein
MESVRTKYLECWIQIYVTLDMLLTANVSGKGAWTEFQNGMQAAQRPALYNPSSRSSMYDYGHTLEGLLRQMYAIGEGDPSGLRATQGLSMYLEFKERIVDKARAHLLPPAPDATDSLVHIAEKQETH